MNHPHKAGKFANVKKQAGETLGNPTGDDSLQPHTLNERVKHQAAEAPGEDAGDSPSLWSGSRDTANRKVAAANQQSSSTDQEGHVSTQYDALPRDEQA